MSLKMMKNTLLVSALVAMGSIAAIGCGDDGEKEPTTPDAGGGGMPGGGDEDGGGGPVGPATRTRMGTLVGITATDTSAPIKVPHKIVVLNALTGAPLDPPLSTMTSATDGTWMIKDIPTAAPVALHIQGQGAWDPAKPMENTSTTYDSVITNITGETADDGLTRISTAGTAGLAGQVSMFTQKQDRGAISGGVYLIRNGMRVGVVGCVKVKLDDSDQATTDADLRYVGSAGLPAPLSAQDKTEKQRGAFLIANIPKGKHTLSFSVDDFKTTFNKTDIFIGIARDDASGNFKSVLYQIGIEVKGDDPTPMGCM
jgi:hypothetical protein